MNKQQMQEEIDNLRERLYLERQDHAKNLDDYRRIGHQLLKSRMRVNRVESLGKDGITRVLNIIEIKEMGDQGLIVVVEL